MAKDWTVVGDNELKTKQCVVASATVIEPGDLVELDTGLIVKGTATGTALAYCPNGSADGETLVDVTVGNDFELEGTAADNFAVTQKGVTYDVSIDGTQQKINQSASTLNVLRMSIGNDAGTAGSKLNVRVKIEAPLF